MALEAETTTDIDPLTAGLQAVADLQEANEDDLHKLRLALYRSGPLSHDQVERFFDAHNKMPATDGLWVEFFIEALADFFLTRRGDQIYLTDNAEDRLFGAIGEGAPIIDLGHRRLMLRLLLRATKVSERYRRLVFDTVHHHLMHDQRRLLIDLPRQAGAIDVVDLQLIRKLIRGAGGQYPCAIGRAAADFLLILDQAPLAFSDQDGWRKLFLKAMSHHLVSNPPHQNHTPGQIDENAAKWLAEQIKAGRSGFNTNALISHLADIAKCLPKCLEALITNGQLQARNDSPRTT